MEVQDIATLSGDMYFAPPIHCAHCRVSNCKKVPSKACLGLPYCPHHLVTEKHLYVENDNGVPYLHAVFPFIKDQFLIPFTEKLEKVPSANNRLRAAHIAEAVDSNSDANVRVMVRGNRLWYCTKGPVAQGERLRVNPAEPVVWSSDSDFRFFNNQFIHIQPASPCGSKNKGPKNELKTVKAYVNVDGKKQKVNFLIPKRDAPTGEVTWLIQGKTGKFSLH